MKTINVKIVHPTNNSDVDIGTPDNILLRDVFSQLIDANFLSVGQPYTGVLMPNEIRKESVPLDNGKTIKENGVTQNDIIQTLIATQAGGGPASLGITDIPKVSFNEMLQQEQSLIMAFNSFKELDEENRVLIAELNKLRGQSSDRKSAVIINTIAGIVISIGTAFVTDAMIPSIATIIAGAIITALGLWLTFKK